MQKTGFSLDAAQITFDANMFLFGIRHDACRGNVDSISAVMKWISLPPTVLAFEGHVGML